MPDKPDSIEAYLHWSSSSLGHHLDDKWRRWYESVDRSIQQWMNTSELPTLLGESLRRAAVEYGVDHATDFYQTRAVPVLDWHIKPADSIINKMFRTNVLTNSEWPQPPAEGWIEPFEIIPRFDDILRSRVVCKYVDGPPLVARFLKEDLEASPLGVSVEIKTRERDSGYYAYHIYFDLELDITSPTWEAVPTSLRVEIQIVTQLQEVLMQLTHRFYEARRLRSPDIDQGWKWRHSSPEFRSAYLGHTLHLLEGLVLDIRDAEIQEN